MPPPPAKLGMRQNKNIDLEGSGCNYTELSNLKAPRVFLPTYELTQLWEKLLSCSHSVVSDSLQPHGLQHARFPCPSPSPGGVAAKSPLGLRAQGSRKTKFWEEQLSHHLLSGTVTLC